MAKQPASQWLNFDIVLPAGTGGRKTPIWGVTPKAGGNRLGVVSWYGPWRKYTYTPAENTVYDAACLHDIAAFCEWLMAERREPA